LGSALAVFAAPSSPDAQKAERVWKLGYVAFDPPPSHDAPAMGLDGLREGLRELGYIEGQNISIEYRWAGFDAGRIEEVIGDLLRANVQMIVTYGTGMVRRARTMTESVPIICALCADMVGGGVVSSLSRPGGNVTGLTVIGPDLAAKRMELLKTVGSLHVIGLHWAAETFPVAVRWRGESEQAARVMGLRFEAFRAETLELVEAHIRAAARERGTGVSFMEEPFSLYHRRRIAALALKYRVPTMFPFREHVEDAGLASYGANFREAFRRSARYVDAILKGAKPADLPVEQPTKFESLINLKTAKALGLTIPPSLLARADQVIE
jgi:putative ABC transport system substrate-binding protein